MQTVLIRIPYRIDELSTSSNSVNHYLATTIDNLIANDLAIDRIYIYQDGAKLPSKPDFFKSCAMNVSRFVASFTDQAYSTKEYKQRSYTGLGKPFKPVCADYAEND